MVIALRVTLGKQCIVQGPLYVQFFFGAFMPKGVFMPKHPHNAGYHLHSQIFSNM